MACGSGLRPLVLLKPAHRGILCVAVVLVVVAMAGCGAQSAATSGSAEYRDVLAATPDAIGNLSKTLERPIERATTGLVVEFSYWPEESASGEDEVFGVVNQPPDGVLVQVLESGRPVGDFEVLRRGSGWTLHSVSDDHTTAESCDGASLVLASSLPRGSRLRVVRGAVDVVLGVTPQGARSLVVIGDKTGRLRAEPSAPESGGWRVLDGPDARAMTKAILEL